jgi:hypothetical protein
MTSRTHAADPNSAKLRAAFTLQRHAPRMLRRLVAAVLPLLFAGVAHAQMSTSATTTCTAGAMMANIGLVVPFNGSAQNIASTSNTTVFGIAECECQTNDILLQLQITMAYPQSMANGQLQLWAGPSCDNQLNRTNGTCSQITSSTVNFNSFVTGTTSTSAYLNINIPAGPLYAPSMIGTCPMGQQLANNFYLLFAPPGTDITTMPQVCSITLGQNTQTPFAITSVNVSAGDSAVSLNWTAPVGVGEQVPFEYQVLCADANGLPIPGQNTSDRGYSVCLNGAIQRRTNYVIAGSGATTTTDDAGTPQPTPDLGPKEPAPPALGPDDVHTDAVGDMGVADGGVVITDSTFATTLDPAFLCSGEIKPTGTQLSFRVSGLTNQQTYQFVVLAIDQSGNAIASPVLLGTPTPTEDLYTRYRDAGGTASGFCFIATAAFGSYEDRYVKVLRDFRDEILLPTESGHDFVDWYYEHSPPWASFIADHYAARVATQLLLWPVIGVAALIVYTTAWQKLLFCALLLALVLRKRLRKSVRA